MSFSALLLYGYVFGLGLALFFALRWFRCAASGVTAVMVVMVVVLQAGAAARVLRLPAASAFGAMPGTCSALPGTVHFNSIQLGSKSVRTVITSPCPPPCGECRSEIRLSNVWCIYGYSLTAFIPMAFLCIIPLGWVRWLVVGVATGVSGAFILANLKQTIFTAAPARATALLGLLAALHAGLGLALRLVFFRYRGAPEDVAAG